jgi:hypothetical protein
VGAQSSKAVVGAIVAGLIGLLSSLVTGSPDGLSLTDWLAALLWGATGFGSAYGLVWHTTNAPYQPAAPKETIPRGLTGMGEP